MRRSLSILLWVLLGALASGTGVGYVLYQAKQERLSLATQIQEANRQVATLTQQLRTLSLDSNQKVLAAAQEVRQSQAALQSQQAIQTALLTATPLYPPPARQTKGWTETASVPMGVSLRVPPGMRVDSSDDGLFVSYSKSRFAPGVEERWFALSLHRPDRADAIRSRLTNITPVHYALGPRLIQGVRGDFVADGGRILLLTVFQNATSTHLLWAKATERITERIILDTIATLSFK